MDPFEAVKHILGLGFQPKDLGFVQVSLRAIVVFIAALVMVRVSNRRFLGKLSAFDVILGFILASMLARAVNGSSPFFPTLAAGFVLVGLHALIAVLAFHWRWIGFLVKGRSDVLVTDGRPDRVRMNANRVSDADLMEEARLNGNIMELSEIRRATMERNGQISIVPME
jgi:uncharacterized membrane protein YcaP (DUF421 family)